MSEGRNAERVFIGDPEKMPNLWAGLTFKGGSFTNNNYGFVICDDAGQSLADPDRAAVESELARREREKG